MAPPLLIAVLTSSHDECKQEDHEHLCETILAFLWSCDLFERVMNVSHVNSLCAVHPMQWAIKKNLCM